MTRLGLGLVVIPLLLAGCAQSNSAPLLPPSEIRSNGLLPGEADAGYPDFKPKLDPSAPIHAPAGTHTCAPNDRADCEEQCRKDNASSCRALGDLRSANAPYLALLAYARACVRNDDDACLEGARLLEQQPPPELRTDAQLVFRYQSCRLGNLASCKLVATHAENVYFHRVGGPELAARCGKGNAEACTLCREVARYERAEEFWDKDLAPCWKDACDREAEPFACSAALYAGKEGWHYDLPVMESLLALQAAACEAGNATACEAQSRIATRRTAALATQAKAQAKADAASQALRDEEAKLKAEAEERRKAERNRPDPASEQARDRERTAAAYKRAQENQDARDRAAATREAEERAAAQRAADTPPPLPPGKQRAYKCQLRGCTDMGYGGHCRRWDTVWTWCFE